MRNHANQYQVRECAVVSLSFAGDLLGQAHSRFDGSAEWCRTAWDSDDPDVAIGQIAKPRTVDADLSAVMDELAL
jgi:hypothetical protein